MAMRSIPDRIRHTLLFEALGLAIVIPAGSYLFNLPAGHMGVVGFGSATIATVWNFIYNLGFDHTMIRLVGHTRKSVSLRVAHALLFEAGLLAILLPLIAWYLGLSLWATFVMDLAIVVFYVCYAYAFNLAYDRIFPIPVHSPAYAGT